MLQRLASLPLPAALGDPSVPPGASVEALDPCFPGIILIRPNCSTQRNKRICVIGQPAPESRYTPDRSLEITVFDPDR